MPEHASLDQFLDGQNAVSSNHQSPQTVEKQPTSGSESHAQYARERENRGRKVTRTEHEQRIDTAALLLSQRFYKSDIKRVLMKRFQFGPKRAEHYITLGKQRLMERSGRTQQEHYIESEAFWEGIVSNPVHDLRDRMAAQRELDWLYHLKGPNGPVMQTNVNIQTGVQPVRRIVVDSVAEARELLGRLEAGTLEQGPKVVEPIEDARPLVREIVDRVIKAKRGGETTASSGR